MNCYTKEVVIDMLGQKKVVLVGKRKVMPTCLIIGGNNISSD